MADLRIVDAPVLLQESNTTSLVYLYHKTT